MTIEIGFDNGEPVTVECGSYSYSAKERWIELYRDTSRGKFMGLLFYKYFIVRIPNQAA